MWRCQIPITPPITSKNNIRGLKYGKYSKRHKQQSIIPKIKPFVAILLQNFVFLPITPKIIASSAKIKKIIEVTSKLGSRESMNCHDIKIPKKLKTPQHNDTNGSLLSVEFLWGMGTDPGGNFDLFIFPPN